MVKMLLQVTSPNPDNGITASSHVSILGLIELYTLLLSAIRLFELSRVEMPVVTVKLNNRIEARYKGINTELFTYQVLRFIFYTQLSEQVIADSFNMVRTHALLFSIQSYKHLVSFGVCITAWYRAIHDVIGFTTRGRPSERFTTYFTYMASLIASLILGSMFKGTKEIITFIKAAPSYPSISTAYFTRSIFTCFTSWFRRIAVTLQRAIYLMRPQSTSNGFTALACYGFNFVLIFHTVIISCLIATVKPIEVM